MGPLSQADGHDCPWLVDEPVPGIAAMVEDIGVGSEDPVGQPVFPHELPDVFGRVELGRFGRQRHEADVVGDVELGREVPTGLVEQQHRMGAGLDRLRDLCQMQRHRGGVAARQHKTRRCAARWADRAKDIGRAGALIVGCAGSRSPPRPSSGNLVLLADPSLVLEPNLYRFANRLPLGDLRQLGSEVFLNSATASPS